jgi:hypothetical protein
MTDSPAALQGANAAVLRTLWELTTDETTGLSLSPTDDVVIDAEGNAGITAVRASLHLLGEAGYVRFPAPVAGQPSVREVALTTSGLMAAAAHARGPRWERDRVAVARAVIAAVPGSSFTDLVAASVPPRVAMAVLLGFSQEDFLDARTDHITGDHKILGHSPALEHLAGGHEG